jgi:hypothetical protein
VLVSHPRNDLADLADLGHPAQRLVVQYRVPVPIEDDDVPAVSERGPLNRRFGRKLVALTRLCKTKSTQNNVPLGAAHGQPRDRDPHAPTLAPNSLAPMRNWSP